MYKLKLGKSIDAWSESFYQNIENAKTLGFDTVDFDITKNGFFKTQRDCAELKNHLNAIKDSGLILNGIHLPYGDENDISSSNKAVREKAIENILEFCKLTESFNPKCYILHGSFEPILDAERNERLEILVNSMKIILKSFPNVALENLPRTCLLNTADEMLLVKEKLPEIKFCLDTNHFLRERTGDAIEKVGDSIITTHISDYDFVFERHLLPEHIEGRLNWNEIISKLEKIGYNGVFNYEAKATLEQIKENYEKLFYSYNKSCE